jgi:methyl-accepting chemotaxis protein
MPKTSAPSWKRFPASPSRPTSCTLNAAIEAARAGEQGRGFAVVADEVRKLAEQSSDLAGEITNSITTVQTEILNAVAAMHASASHVSGGIEVVAVAGASFQKIQDAVNEVATQIQEVSSSVQHMAVGAQQVTGSVETIKNVVEEQAAGTQTVSASTEDQLASMEEITATAASLSNMAEQLEGIIKKFKL